MLKNVLVATPGGVLELVLTGSGVIDTDPLHMRPIQVRGIDGLGPVAAAINTTPFGSFDGELYTGGSVGKRNIVIRIGTNPDWLSQTLSNLRQYLYRFFMPKQKVTMIFATDDYPDCSIEGYVETVEPNIFSNDPEIAISIICPKPDFIATDSTVQLGVVGLGPWDNDPVLYEGNVPTGFTLSVRPTDDNTSYSGDLTVQVGGRPGITIEDITVDNTLLFKMSSVRDDKYIQSIAVPSDDTENLLHKMAAGSVWPEIATGATSLSVWGTEAGQEWTLTYKARFGGL